jgi:HK97 family phage major capsid protein
MKTYEQLRQMIDDHVAKAEGLLAMLTEKADELTDEEKTEIQNEIDSNLDTAKELEPQAKKAKEREEFLARQKEIRNQMSNVRPVQLSETSTGNLPVNVKRHFCRNFEAWGGVTAEEQAYHFGNFFLTVCDRLIPAVDFPTARQKTAERFGPLNVATEGGNASIYVPDEFAATIIKLILNYGVARRLFDVRTMSSDVQKFPKKGSDVRAYWDGENAALTDGTPTDDMMISLTARKLRALASITQELAEDAVISIADEMAERIALGMARKEDEAFFNGTGTDAFGGNVGLRTAMQNTWGVVTGNGQVLMAGNELVDLTLDECHEVIAKTPDMVGSEGQVWVCNKFLWANHMVELAFDAGGVTATEIMNGQTTPMFLGYPVVFSNAYPRTNANSQIIATFGDHSRVATIGDRRTISLTTSNEATAGGVSAFDNDLIHIKGVERTCISVHSTSHTYSHDGTAATEAGPVVSLMTAAS